MHFKIETIVNESEYRKQFYLLHVTRRGYFSVRFCAFRIACTAFRSIHSFVVSVEPFSYGVRTVMSLLGKKKY